MKVYFENTIELEKLRDIPAPSGEEFENVLRIINDDKELMLYFYDKLSPSWLDLLEEAKEFDGLDVKEAGLVERYKTVYLFECAEANPEVVLRIIKGMAPRDAWIQGKLVGAISKMPEQIAVEGVPVVLDYVGKRENIVWFFAGEETAKLMMKLVENYPEEAIKIAKALLDIWRLGEKEAGVFERIRSKFATHEYKELIFNYYSKVWEKRPFESISILVDIYDKYLDEFFKEKNYDVSEYLGVSLRDLEDDYHSDRDIESILVKAMCEAGLAVIKKEPDKVSELLENLEKRNKGVLQRVEMYLLRFVPVEAEKDRINKIISNQKFIESSYFKYEHRHLLNDKFDEVRKETREKFIEWISQQKITSDRKKEVEDWCLKNNKELPDFEKWENQAKAEELYLARERFKELYDEYKNKSGLNDDALAPRPMVSKARAISPMESTPLTLEEMTKKSCDEVLDFILEPSNYEKDTKEDGRHWESPEYGLAETFKNDVKQRPRKYLSCDLRKLAQLGPYFLSRFFYGLHETIREKDTERNLWVLALELASKIVKKNGTNEEYRTCFSAILSTFHDGFRNDDKGIEFNPERVKIFWKMIEILTRYPIGDMSRFSDEENDPIQIRCNFVPGQAVELSVLLGIVCKNDFGKFYDEYLMNKIRRSYERILNDIRIPGINCTFGSEFARIYWMDSEWIKDNLEKIFCDELWDEIWGSYVSWGRPSPQSFKLLVEKGIYDRAVEKIGEKNQYKFGKEPEEGLVEHLMIGYFNGWINYDSNVLNRYFENESAELHGYAARFLTTGFKSVNEEGGKEKDEVAERMRAYWNGRLAVIKDKPKENEKEAIELTGWVEDSVLPAKETLELLEKTLNLSSGKIGEMRDAKEFIEGICNLGKGNELLALRCLKIASEEKNMHSTWSMIQEPLLKFLEELPEEVRGEGKNVADLYGRYNPGKFRDVWEKLNVAMGSD